MSGTWAEARPATRATTANDFMLRMRMGLRYSEGCFDVRYGWEVLGGLQRVVRSEGKGRDEGS